MITLRPTNQRGHASHGWLNSYHTFSFADYYDPQHMGVSALRVINDDTVAPKAGFPMHAHRDMEIISYVLSGALEHKDNMGNGSVIRPGEVQCMSAGTGVMHSEYNPSSDDNVNFLQIWIMPNEKGVQPGYEQQDFSSELENQLTLVASPDGRDDSLTIHQDALLYASRIKAGTSINHTLNTGRTAYLHLAKGEARVNNLDMQHGDGVTINNEERISITTNDQAEILLFDLP
ncbi:MAG: pirin family protein [Gammaproteobacteria bacterium]|nr:pirin family protein [Gammaproteobacteria bacterium]